MSQVHHSPDLAVEFFVLEPSDEDGEPAPGTDALQSRTHLS